MTRRVNTRAVDLIFTLEGAAKRVLGVIYNLLPWDERICSKDPDKYAVDCTTIQVETLASFLSTTPPFCYHDASTKCSTLVYGNSRSVYVYYCTWFWSTCQ